MFPCRCSARPGYRMVCDPGPRRSPAATSSCAFTVPESLDLCVIASVVIDVYPGSVGDRRKLRRGFCQIYNEGNAIDFAFHLLAILVLDFVCEIQSLNVFPFSIRTRRIRVSYIVESARKTRNDNNFGRCKCAEPIGSYLSVFTRLRSCGNPDSLPDNYTDLLCVFGLILLCSCTVVCRHMI